MQTHIWCNTNTHLHTHTAVYSSDRKILQTPTHAGESLPADSAVCMSVWWLCCSYKTQSGAFNTISWELHSDSSRLIKAIHWVQVNSRSVIRAAAGTQQLFSERWRCCSAVSFLSAAGWRLMLDCIYPAPSTNPVLRIGHVCKALGPRWPLVLQTKSSWIR